MFLQGDWWEIGVQLYFSNDLKVTVVAYLETETFKGNDY